MRKPNEAFASRLREYRLERRITQGEMADSMGIPRATFNTYENGKSVPDINVLVSVAAYMRCSMEYLLGLSEYTTYQREVNAREIVEKTNDAGEEAALRIIQTAKSLLSRYNRGDTATHDHYLEPLARICDQVDKVQKYILGYTTDAEGNTITKATIETWIQDKVYHEMILAAHKAFNDLMKGF